MSAIAARLTGRIALRLDPVLPRLSNERPDLVPALTRGRPASALPGLLSALFAMCAHAHRLTAQRAVLAAQGEVSPLSAVQAHELQLETVREHLRRLWLDWPRLLWGPKALSDSALAVLAGCPALQADAHQLAQVRGLQACGKPSALPPGLTGWLSEHVFGQDVSAWLQAWQAQGEDFVRHWCETTATLPASEIQAVCTRAAATRQPLSALRIEDGPVLRTLAAHLATYPSCARTPTWAGKLVETGPWCRAHQCDQPQGTPSLLYRMGGRLADLARLALPDQASDGHAPGITGPCGRHVLQAGAVQLGDHSGLAWTEMARGTLLHWVHLRHEGGQPLIAACQVIAPTEWNFHPQGPVAELLTASEADLPRRLQLAPLLTAVYDPCVPLAVLGADGLPVMHCPPMGQTTDMAHPTPREGSTCTS